MIYFRYDPQTPKWGLKSATKKRFDVKEKIRYFVFKPPFGGLGVNKKTNLYKH